MCVCVLFHRVWREWVIENDTFVGMHYVMGQECSIGEREVKVLFNCSTMTRLHSTSELSTCHYVVWLDTPLACFKGAMQGKGKATKLGSKSFPSLRLCVYSAEPCRYYNFAEIYNAER